MSIHVHCIYSVQLQVHVQYIQRCVSIDSLVAELAVIYPFLSPSLLPAIMQHRRTVSDTLLFRRPSLLEELKKDGPSSSHSSRSATPLLALFQPTGEGGVVGQAIVGQGAGSKVPGVVTPQHSPQQQKISPREVCRFHCMKLVVK